MDFENLLPLALAAIYILTRVFKAKPKKDAPHRPVSPRHTSTPTTPVTQKSTEPRKTFSFEDILKEFEKNLAGADYAEEKPMPVDVIDYEEPEQSSYVEPKPSPYHTYEGYTYETLPKQEEEKLLDQIKERLKSEHFEESEFVKMIREPDGARNAIIMSEIINRKYFEI